MKKQIALCLCTAMIISTFSTESARAAEIVHQWNYSDADDGAIVATLMDDGLMSIQGSGWCNPPGDNNFWDGWDELGYNNSIQEVLYGEGILGTAGSDFYACRNINKITLPTSLRKIQYSSFFYTNISEISIPDSVTEIGTNAFGRCEKLESVKLPVSLQQMGDRAFDGCKRLNEVIIDCPKLELIEEYTFRDCSNLRSVKIDGGLKEIDYDAFSQCKNLESVTLPEGLDYIHRAFDGCYKLTDIIIPKSVTYIDQRAFEDVPGPIGVLWIVCIT